MVRTAVSHPLNKRFRTGSTVSMFTMVIFAIIMVSVMTGIFSMDLDSQVAKQGGGYQIMGSTMAPVEDLSNASMMDAQGRMVSILSPTLSEQVVDYVQISLVLPSPDIYVDGALFDANQSFVLPSVMAVDQRFMSHAQFRFTDLASGYATPEQAWAAVQQDPGKVVFGGDATFGSVANVHAGSVITLETAAGPRDFTVVGVIDTSLLSGVIMSKPHAREMFSSPQTMVGDLLYLFKVRPGADVRAVTLGLERDFRALGMDTTDLNQMVAAMLEAINSVFLLFQVFLGLGLVVGVTGLGIITIRSVVERRREIGVLRAVGFSRREIMASFVIETLFIATLAVAIGLVVALLVAFELFSAVSVESGVTWSVPWGTVGLLIGITYSVALVCTILPAFRASRIPPAEALRGSE
jgi:putative ABC transport system permease protein